MIGTVDKGQAKNLDDKISGPSQKPTMEKNRNPGDSKYCLIHGDTCPKGHTSDVCKVLMGQVKQIHDDFEENKKNCEGKWLRRCI